MISAENKSAYEKPACDKHHPKFYQTTLIFLTNVLEHVYHVIVIFFNAWVYFATFLSHHFAPKIWCLNVYH